MKSCLGWADFGLISSRLNVMEVSGPKSSCCCTLGVLTLSFINCLIERGFCVVCPTLPALSICVLCWRFARPSLLALCSGFLFFCKLFYVVCLSAAVVNWHIDSDTLSIGFFSVFCMWLWWMWINRVTCLYGFILRTLPPTTEFGIFTYAIPPCMWNLLNLIGFVKGSLMFIILKLQ